MIQDDATNTTPPEDQAPTTQSAATNVRSFSQDEVNRLTSKARNEGRESASKKAPAMVPAPDEQTATLQAQIAELTAQRSFDKLASRHGIPDDAADDMFQLFKIQSPENPAEWFAQKANRFGAKASATQQTNLEPMKPAAAAPAAPARVDTMSAGGLVDIYSMAPEVLAQLSPQEIRAHHERNIVAATMKSGAPPVPHLKR